MKNLLQTLCATLLLLAFATPALAQNQNIKISIQGTLKDANSAAVDDGVYDVTFRLYNTNSGGTAVWEETANVQVSGGVYSHRLGSVEALDEADFSETLFVGVEVNGVELSPRTELTYAPYTLNTQFAARAGNGVPSGSMMPFAGPLGNVPDDYVPCDGRALASADYPELFAAIGTAWGDGSSGAGAVAGTTDFNVPDSRGVFLRGWANGSSNDPDRTSRSASAAGGATGDNVGTYQADNNKSHSHSFSDSGFTGYDGTHTHSMTRRGNGDDEAYDAGNSKASESSAATTDRSSQGSFNTGSGGSHRHSFSVSGTTSSSGSEARPKNIAVLYIIKK